MADVLYHYTNESGFRKILKKPEKFIDTAQKFSRNRSTEEDPDYKAGIFFTDIAPQNNTWGQIAEYLFGDDSDSSLAKCEYFVVIQHWGNVKQFETNNRIYMLPESTTTKQKFIIGGRTEFYAIPTDDSREITIGKPYITVYEKARIIGARALQLSHGAPPLIDIKDNMDLIELAQLELKTRVLPIGIERKLANGRSQVIPIQWLSDKDFLQQIDVSREMRIFREALQQELPEEEKESTKEEAEKEVKKEVKKETEEDKGEKKREAEKEEKGINVIGLINSVLNSNIDIKPPTTSTEASLKEIKNKKQSKMAKLLLEFEYNGNKIICPNEGIYFKKGVPESVFFITDTTGPSKEEELVGMFAIFALEELGFDISKTKAVFVRAPTTEDKELIESGKKNPLSDIEAKIAKRGLTEPKRKGVEKTLAKYFSGK